MHPIFQIILKSQGNSSVNISLYLIAEQSKVEKIE